MFRNAVPGAQLLHRSTNVNLCTHLKMYVRGFGRQPTFLANMMLHFFFLWYYSAALVFLFDFRVLLVPDLILLPWPSCFPLVLFCFPILFVLLPQFLVLPEPPWLVFLVFSAILVFPQPFIGSIFLCFPTAKVQNEDLSVFLKKECSEECTCCNMYTDCTCYNMYINMYKVPMYMLVYMLERLCTCWCTCQNDFVHVGVHVITCTNSVHVRVLNVHVVTCTPTCTKSF